MKLEEVKIGYWVLLCCCEDAEQIDTEDYLLEVKEFLKEERENPDEPPFHYVFATTKDLVDAGQCGCPGTKCQKFGFEKKENTVYQPNGIKLDLQ